MLPFQFGVYLTESAHFALLMLVIPSILSNAYLGCTIATVHCLVGLRMRALSSAVLFFILNMIGLGTGPSTVGLVSDWLAQSQGSESLRYALLFIVPPALIWSGVHYWRAGHYLVSDLEVAPE